MRGERTTSKRRAGEARPNRRVRRMRRAARFGIAIWSSLTAFGFVWNAFNVRAIEPRRADDASGGGVLFVPTQDLESPTVFSAVDATRRNRPPQPSKIREDLFYPDGFLEPSTPTPEPIDETAVDAPNVAPVVPRGLNPRAETTPLSPPASPDSSDAPPKRGRGDRLVFFATSIALAALGLFLYFDRQYRVRLKTDLARNARLRDPNAVGADFDDVLAKAEAEGELDDSYLDPALDVSSDFSGSGSASGRAETPTFGGANASNDFETSESFDSTSPSTPEPFAATGALAPDATEENFDFKPSEREPRIEEPQEDFVVGANLGR